MTKQYAVITDTSDIITCHGVFDDFAKAIGVMLIEVDEYCGDWKRNADPGQRRYILDELDRTEGDTGYCLFAYDEAEPGAKTLIKGFVLDADDYYNTQGGERDAD